MSVTWPDVMKFDVPDNAVIFDIGGYKGDWVRIAIDNYENPTIYVFEPVKKFYDEIVERWKDQPNVKVYNFGLSDKNREEEISIEGDSSSVFKKTGNLETIKLRDIREFLFEEEIFQVHLAKINIEGEEYRLMEYLISTPELNIIENYLIQFHTFIDNHIERRNGIVEGLGEYYDRIFNFEFIFEGWSTKKLQKINCFGDSHISAFTNQPDLIKENEITPNGSIHSFRFGPYLAYNLPQKENVLPEFKRVSAYENILFCFGEIDCRAQVHRIAESSEKNTDQVIDDIVDNYFSVIDSVGNKNVILFSVTPELKEQPHWYYYKDKPQLFDCPKGTLAERSSYKSKFNSRIKEEAESRGYKYASFYEEIMDEDGKPREMYYMDDIHLEPKKVFYLIKRALIRAGLTQ
jgi:FkbM family methyltransferase